MTDDSLLVLASEDFSVEEFSKLHKFSQNDERVINKLMAHGPVLLQGSRGSGKSALMRAAAIRMKFDAVDSAFGIYLSLRHMPLLTSEGQEYQKILCDLIINKVQRELEGTSVSFEANADLLSLQMALGNLSANIQKRIVLLFDDAAHIGREASLADFFDIFRTLGNSSVSCKATIYPGVTNFGKRFDVYNDATVVDVIRDENQPEYAEFFLKVLTARFPTILEKGLVAELEPISLSFFLGRSVLGNMRSFVFVCNNLQSQNEKIGLQTLTKTFLDMTNNLYWPLIEEVKPKLGKYASVIDPAKQIAEHLFLECGKQQSSSVLIHRDIISRLSKAFEILEYVGFISKREASRAMKSGGRGSKYALNLCMLIENVSGARVTSDLFQKWKKSSDDEAQFHIRGAFLTDINLPNITEDRDPEIFENDVGTLKKSKVYPYGLTDILIEKLHTANINTIKDLYTATDAQLDEIHYVGTVRINKMRELVTQAIWL